MQSISENVVREHETKKKTKQDTVIDTGSAPVVPRDGFIRSGADK